MEFEMDLYYNGNGNIWSENKSGTKLSVLPVGKTFLWGGQEVFIPAVYLGEPGVMLDICTKISVRDMIHFLEKWDKDRRLSVKTKEEFDQLDADNPSAREFTANLQLDGTALTNRMFGSIRWYPQEILESDSVQDSGEKLENNKKAEELMRAYGCDRKCCWHFARHIYDWPSLPILTPTEISLSLQAHTFPVTAGYFTTAATASFSNISPGAEPSGIYSHFPADMEITHPYTGQRFVLTLHGLDQVRNSFTDTGAEDVIYPEYCQILSYSVSPETGRDLFDILDCQDGDQPRMKGARDENSGEVCGPTAVFMAGKNPGPNGRSTCSALHFAPVDEVRWRVVFQVKEKEDMTVTFTDCLPPVSQIPQAAPPCA